MAGTNVERVLVVMPSRFGDCVMAHSLIRELASRGLAVDILSDRLYAPLGALMPECAGMIITDFVRGKVQFRKRYRCAKLLVAQQYSVAYVLPNKFKSALMPCFARIPQRVGWRGEMRYGLLTDLRRPQKSLRHYAARFAALAHVPGAGFELYHPQLEVASAYAHGILTKFGLTGIAGLLAICPGSSGESKFKRWPTSRFASLTSAHAIAGGSIVILGTADDSVAGEEIRTAVKANSKEAKIFNLAGHTSINEAAAVLRTVVGTVANDSGLMHISAALGTPTVGVFGPTEPEDSGPLGERVAVASAGVNNIARVPADLVMRSLLRIMRK